MPYQRVAELLNENGFVTEVEDLVGEPFMTSVVGKDAILREHGYTGGKLSIECKEFPGEGWLYALYDTSRIGSEEALSELGDAVRRGQDEP